MKILKKGYWIVNRKRFYYIAYTNGTWRETNSKYEPK